MSTKKTIAKSFTVSTIEDGVSVQAQYAPNANPTSGQIHTVWQNGDLYMRTRESDEAAWSSWHKIVGENGDETDFSFGISKYKTTANAKKAPSDISTWSDAPLAVTSAKPYLWAKVQQKSWNASTQAYVVDSTRYIRLTGEEGTSPYFADLNNEMDAIQCKHDGSVIADQTVSTVISMWKGSSVEAFVIDNIYRNGTQLTWGSTSNGVKASKSGSTVSIEFNTNASIADIDDFKITIHSYNDNTVTRELHFTINGVRANAIYRLVPSHSQIVKKKDGTYNPDGNVTCSVEKTENGSTSTPASSEYTLEKSVNGGSYTAYSATAASSITSDLKFSLKVGDVVVDLETIPLVSDGEKGNTGDSAPNAFANPAQISIPCYSNGNVKAETTTPVTFSLKVGTNAATVSSVSSGTKPTGVVVTGVVTNVVTIKVQTTATASGISSGVTFTVSGTYDGKTYSANVTVALIGSEQGETGPQSTTPGPRGKIGRFFYYAGAWNDFASTDSFLVNDAQAPYFAYNSNYWVFNPETNGTYTKQDMGTPSSSSSNWNMMYNEFKYIITEAIFGAYSHFGSFIINGDWMLSENGYLNGTLYTGSDTYSGVPAYTYFDAQYPQGSRSIEITSSSVTSTTPSRKTNYFSTSGKRIVKIKGKVTSGGTMYVCLYLSSGSAISTPVAITSTSDVSVTINYGSAASSSCYVGAYMSNSSYSGTITAVSVESFAPNYAVDGLTGKSYQNDAYLKGLIYATGGTITGDMNITGSLTIGTYGSNLNSIVLSPSPTNPSIVGYIGTTEVFRIGTQVYYDGSTLPTIKIGRSCLRENILLIYDSEGSIFHAEATRIMVEREDSGLHYPFSIDVDSNKKVILKANGKAMWPTSKSEVGWGGVYVDGTTLRVNMDG